MKTSILLKWITGGLEILLGIPFVGMNIITSLRWAPIWIMLILHIVTLVFSLKERTKKNGSIMGIVTNIIGFIPIIGMVMRLITGVILLRSAAKNEETVAGDVNLASSYDNAKNSLDKGKKVLNAAKSAKEMSGAAKAMSVQTSALNHQMKATDPKVAEQRAKDMEKAAAAGDHDGVSRAFMGDKATDMVNKESKRK